MTTEPDLNVNIELTNESCFNLLPRLEKESVDLFLIDPPYDISRKTGFSAVGDNSVDRFAVSMDFGKWDWGTTDLNTVCKEAYRSLRKGGSIIVFYDLWKISELSNWLIEAGFKQLRFLEWVKTNPVPINSKINYLTNSREVAVLAVKKGKPTFNSEYDNGMYQYPICHEKGRFHPTQKPFNLIRDLVVKHSNEGDVVVDCFSGSGTTAACCASERRNFIGCELDVDFHKKSIERIESLTKSFKGTNYRINDDMGGLLCRP